MMNLQFAPLVPDVWKALEREERAGWVKRGVKNPETVAEHTVELMLIGDEYASAVELSSEEQADLMAMLEVHDMPEAIDGDVITLHGVDHEQEAKDRVAKFEREYTAMRSITKDLGLVGERMLGYWLRFEKSDDRVAVAGRGIDKYQAIERAYRYEREQGIVGLGDEFLKFSPPLTIPYLIARLRTYQ